MFIQTTFAKIAFALLIPDSQSYSDFLWFSSDSELQMADKLTSVIEMFHSFKKSGRSATLTMSTKGGQATKVKLEVELDDATPPSSSPSSTSTSTAPSLPGCQATGDRHRPHGSTRRRAKANARAAQHRIFQALPFPEGFSDAQSLPGLPPTRRPLQHHPSPTVKDRRKILTVKKPSGCQPPSTWTAHHLLQHFLHHLIMTAPPAGKHISICERKKIACPLNPWRLAAWSCHANIVYLYSTIVSLVEGSMFCKWRCLHQLS